MAEVTPIHPAPNPTVVEHLEEMLHMARIGDIQGLAYVAIFENGSTDNGWAGSDDGNIAKRLLAELCLLRAKFEDDLME